MSNNPYIPQMPPIAGQQQGRPHMPIPGGFGSMGYPPMTGHSMPMANLPPNGMLQGNIPQASRPMNNMPVNNLPPMPSTPSKGTPEIKPRFPASIPGLIGSKEWEIEIPNDLIFDFSHPIVELKEISREVADLNLVLLENRISIKGTLVKNITCKIFDGPGRVWSGDDDITVISGSLKHITVKVPFKSEIEMQGVKPEDKMLVEPKEIDDDCDENNLESSFRMRGCSLPVYRKLKSKTTLKISVKVLRPEMSGGLSGVHNLIK